MERATEAEKRRRIEEVQAWITAGEVGFQEAIRRIRERWGLGRRQSIRYWVAARRELMSPWQRYRRRLRPMTRDRHGRFRSRSLTA